MLKIKVPNILIKHKWIALLIIFVFMALSAGTIDYIKRMWGIIPTFFEVIVEQTNDPQMILFPLMFVLLFFTMLDKERELKKSMPSELLKDTIYYTSLYIVLFIIANLLHCIMFIDLTMVFKDSWTYSVGYPIPV